MNHCVQCGKPLKFYIFRIQELEGSLYYCLNVHCPNFGLLQSGIEDLPEKDVLETLGD